MITIERQIFTTKSTIGRLTIGDFECWTLEDVARPPGVKIYGETCIPAGDYTLKITNSPRFGRMLPLLFNRPEEWTVDDGHGVVFTGVRIHPGNTAEDTHGCILPGMEKGENMVYRSRDAFVEIMARLKENEFYDVEIINKQMN